MYIHNGPSTLVQVICRTDYPVKCGGSQGGLRPGWAWGWSVVPG